MVGGFFVFFLEVRSSFIFFICRRPTCSRTVVIESYVWSYRDDC